VSSSDPVITVLQRRESYRDWYTEHRDPIWHDRLLWQAQAFRHMVHLLPGETILEIGAGDGRFTEALVAVSRGRNPICSARFGTNQGAAAGPVESLTLDTFPGALAGRQFTYVVMQNILDHEVAGAVLAGIYELLAPGGRVVLFESNPWNPVFAIRNTLMGWFGKPRPQWLINRTDLYEQISEVGFIRVSAQFTDFVYWPLTGRLCRLMRNASVLLENMAFVRALAGRILVHAQKPPRDLKRTPVSLAGHDALRGKVSVVVPCYNEEMNIPPLVAGLKAFYDDYIHQIVLVDDNSKDGTRDVIRRLAEEDPRVTLVARTPPNGVGRAISEGYAAATGEYILSMDCDFQHLLPELEDMFDAIAEGFDAAVGSRFSRHSLLINYPFGKILANRGFHVLFSIMFRMARRDLTNNLKLMRTELARAMELKEAWFAVNAETGLQLALMDCRLKEVPISWINRTFDMGQSTFRVLKVGGGYARVLWRLFMKTKFGTRKLPTPDLGQSAP
jgi:dolichol-phosphate mannosyltransferase